MIPSMASRVVASVFEVIAVGIWTVASTAHAWVAATRPTVSPYKVTASHCHETDSPDAVGDGLRHLQIDLLARRGKRRFRRWVG